MPSRSSSARTAGPKRRFRNAVKTSCSIFKLPAYLALSSRAKRGIYSSSPPARPPERRETLPNRLSHQGGHRHAQAPQKATKSHWRTNKYSIGNDRDQPVPHHKAQHDPTAFFAAVSVNDAVRQSLDATLQRVEIDVGNCG